MLKQPEEEQRYHLHAHHAHERATEAAWVGCVIVGLSHGRQYVRR